MKKKKIGLGLLLIGLTILLTGCMKKDAISAEDFTKAVEKKEYKIVEKRLLSDYAEANTIVSAEIKEGNYIEFFDIKTEEQAIEFFINNKGFFEDEYQNNTVTFSNNGPNYEKYTVTAEGKYIVLSRIDNTIVFVEVDKNLKDKVKDFLEEINY